MLKKIVQISALASALALGIGMPASVAFAYSEEDMAAPQGSFTSDMPVPVGTRMHDRALRGQWFERHMRERMMHRAALEQTPAVQAR